MGWGGPARVAGTRVGGGRGGVREGPYGPVRNAGRSNRRSEPRPERVFRTPEAVGAKRRSKPRPERTFRTPVCRRAASEPRSRAAKPAKRTLDLGGGEPAHPANHGPGPRRSRGRNRLPGPATDRGAGSHRAATEVLPGGGVEE